MRNPLRIGLATVAALLASLALASPALAAFGFENFDVTFSNQDGSGASQAGSHPFAFTTSFTVNSFTDGEGNEVPEGETKNLTLQQIEGLAGNPTATPRCTTAEFIERIQGASQCPDSTAVGLAAVRAAFSPIPAGESKYLHVPVFNLVPPPGVAAKLGFVVLNEPVTVEVGVNQEPPYNIVARLTNIPQVLLFYSSEFTLWGNPSDPAHDSLRGSCVGELQSTTPAPVSHGLCPVNIPEKPFLTLPRACGGPLGTTLQATSWENPNAPPPVEDTAVTHNDSVPAAPQGMSGCPLTFGPEIEASPTTSQAQAPSGLDFSIKVKDQGLTSVNGTAKSDIKKIEATLPEGVTANPSAAEGLGVCSIAQFGAASLAASGCPESSTLGGVEVETPILENRILHGTVYLAQPDDPTTAEPENPFNSLLALYIVIRDPELGILVKQAAKIEPDPKTGQLITTVENLPQFPLSRIDLHFREGPRAPLVTPPGCGTYTAKAVLTPWSGGKTVTSNAQFAITSGPNGTPCPALGAQPFHPGFEAGSINNSAASFSPFYMRLTRNDGEQDMTRFDAILPPGVTGKLAGLAKCSDAQIAAAKTHSGRAELASPSCPEGSRVGRVLVGAGVGPSLTYVPGSIYLAGPFAGDPLSIAVITPGVAGPFDVGTVVTREALTLNPLTAEVEVDGAASDPIPHILKGIPLKVRDIRVYVDRPNFTLNPTSCDEEQVRATLFGGGADVFGSADDVPAGLSTRYQAANCSALAFKPKLSLKLKGGTKRNTFPALRAVVQARPGDANIGAATVTLPHSAFLEQGHIGTICTRVQFAAKACPPASVYGKARAFTPLLDEPLEGPVYLRANGGQRELPDLVAALHGVVDVELVGFIDSVNARIRSRFQTAPDVPLTKFVLEMQGGKKGLLVNNQNICKHTQHAQARFTAHNGKVLEFSPVVVPSCGKKGAAKRRGRH